MCFLWSSSPPSREQSYLVTFYCRNSRLSNLCQDRSVQVYAFITWNTILRFCYCQQWGASNKKPFIAPIWFMKRANWCFEGKIFPWPKPSSQINITEERRPNLTQSHENISIFICTYSNPGTKKKQKKFKLLVFLFTFLFVLEDKCGISNINSVRWGCLWLSIKK